MGRVIFDSFLRTWLGVVEGVVWNLQVQDAQTGIRSSP